MVIRTKIPGFYTTEEAARSLGIGTRQISKYVRDGRLRPIANGKPMLFKQDEIHGFERQPVGNPNFSKKKRKS
jgi:excisionase family DNA binding protein